MQIVVPMSEERKRNCQRERESPFSMTMTIAVFLFIVTVRLCLTLSVCRCPSISPRFGNRLPTHTHTQIYVTVQCSEWTHSTVVIIDFTIYLPSLSLFSSVPKLAPLGCAVLLLSLSVSLCFVSLSICRSLLVVLTSVVSQSLFEVKWSAALCLIYCLILLLRVISPLFRLILSVFPRRIGDFISSTTIYWLICVCLSAYYRQWFGCSFSGQWRVVSVCCRLLSQWLVPLTHNYHRTASTGHLNTGEKVFCVLFPLSSASDTGVCPQSSLQSLSGVREITVCCLSVCLSTVLFCFVCSIVDNRRWREGQGLRRLRCPDAVG